MAKSDPAAQWTRAEESRPYFAYATNYLIDTKSAVIMDVEATRAIRQTEVGASRTVLDRTEKRFGIRPDWLAADTAYGNAENFGWLVEKRSIIPFIPVIDKSERTDGTWSRSDIEWDEVNDQYICPEGHALKQFRRNYSDPTRGQDAGGRKKYRALKATCQACLSKEVCCPKVEAGSVTREPHEEAHECRKTKAYKVSCDKRKKVERLFAHLKRILGLTGYACEAPSAPRTSSSSPPSLRTSGNLRSYGPRMCFGRPWHELSGRIPASRRTDGQLPERNGGATTNGLTEPSSSTDFLTEFAHCCRSC